jgi:hypothetical protein
MVPDSPTPSAAGIGWRTTKWVGAFGNKEWPESLAYDTADLT